MLCPCWQDEQECGKEVVRRGIPQEDSVRQLVELLKEHGRWEDKEETEEGVEEVLAA